MTKIERETIWANKAYRVLTAEKALLSIMHPEPDDLTEIPGYSPGTYRFRFPCGYEVNIYALSLHRAMALACQAYGDYDVAPTLLGKNHDRALP